jgi:predicted secreted protein
MKRSTAGFRRISRLTVWALGVGLALDLGADSSARAQFFFPFFDNRPSTPPGPHIGRPRHNRSEAGEPPHLRRYRDRAARSEEKRPRSGASRKAAESRKSETRRSAKTGKPGEAAKPVPPIVEAPPPTYEPQLLRLSEVMGALSYLQTVCDAPASAAIAATTSSDARDAALDTARNTARDTAWRDRMEALMTAEEAGPSRREKLAGAFNRGWQGYQYSYRICTPNAQLARGRFLEEGARLAHDISMRYRAN